HGVGHGTGAFPAAVPRHDRVLAHCSQRERVGHDQHRPTARQNQILRRDLLLITVRVPLADAMPILEATKDVTVLVVNPDRSMGDTPGSAIALHLARHGINAEAAHITSRDIEVGDVLLNNVSDRGADIVVMGGYGTPRLRELIMGGMTRSIPACRPSSGPD
ncbi:MAG: universal stress protein, partial [Pseudomonadota bacterium]